jgi:hypothetical protein
MSVEEKILKAKISKYDVKRLKAIITCINYSTDKDILNIGNKHELLSKIYNEIDNCLIKFENHDSWNLKNMWVIKGMLSSGSNPEKIELNQMGITTYISFNDANYRKLKYVNHINYSLKNNHILQVAYNIKTMLKNGEKIYMQCNRTIMSIIFLLYGYELDYILDMLKLKCYDIIQIYNLKTIEKFLNTNRLSESGSDSDNVTLLVSKPKISKPILSHAEFDRLRDLKIEAKFLEGIKKMSGRTDGYLGPDEEYNPDIEDVDTSDNSAEELDIPNYKDSINERELESAIDLEYEKWLSWFKKTDGSLDDENAFIYGLQEDIIDASVDLQLLPSIDFLKSLGGDLLFGLGYDVDDEEEMPTVMNWIEQIYSVLRNKKISLNAKY